MQFEPTRPHTPPPPIEPTGFFTGVKIFPVVVGVVVDYVATYAAMYAYFFLYLVQELSKDGEVTEEAILRYMTSTEGLMVGFAIGAACTALGGFVAARKAGTLEIKHGAFVGLGSLILSFIEQGMRGEAMPIPEWFRLLSVIAIIPAGALGGFVAELFKGFSGSYQPGGGVRPGT